MSVNRRFDLVVFGATGFTGVEICKYLAGRAPAETKIAIAARTRDRLERIISDLNVSWDIILASYDVPSSITDMVSQTRVIVNCVGPFNYYGMLLPEACIRAQTDYVDICGEQDFLENTQLKCHEKALAANTIIVQATGIDAIPADMGAWYGYQHLLKQGVKCVDSIESVMTLTSGPEGMALFYTTYEAIINSMAMANVQSANEIKLQLNEYLSRTGKTKSQKAGIKYPALSQRFHYDSRLQKWVIPFPSSDHSVQLRSFYVFSKDADRLPEVTTFASVASWTWAMIITMLVSLVFVMSQFSWTRNILLKYPHIFTLGRVQKTGPTKKQMETSGFHYDVVLKGSTDKSGSGDQIESWVRVSGPDGYITTSRGAVESALVLLSERSKLKLQGGVLTPALAFQGSSLIQNLNNAGITFTIVK